MYNIPVYSCFLYASKAYDRVNHWTLFKKLLKRSISVIIIRILRFWYSNQKLYKIEHSDFLFLYKRNVLLTRSAGGSLTSKSEAEVLSAIRTLTVREENTMVARVALHNMRQDRDEPVRNFGARLRGQAGVCKFIIPCPSCTGDVNYTDEILRDVVTRNISDSEVQLDLLGDSNHNMTLEEVLKFIEAKEAGKRSASRLLHTQNVDAARSSYRKDKSCAFKSKPEHSNDHCIYCGKQGHGKRSLPRVRQRQCPAYGHRCKHCSHEHHFDQMCRSRDTTSNCTTSEEHEDTVFNTLCSATSVHSIGNKCSISLDHHLYNNICDQWLQRSSQQ